MLTITASTEMYLKIHIPVTFEHCGEWRFVNSHALFVNIKVICNIISLGNG